MILTLCVQMWTRPVIYRANDAQKTGPRKWAVPGPPCCVPLLLSSADDSITWDPYTAREQWDTRLRFGYAKGFMSAPDGRDRPTELTLANGAGMLKIRREVRA